MLVVTEVMVVGLWCGNRVVGGGKLVVIVVTIMVRW